MRPFFGFEFPMPGPRRQEGTGSGFIVTPDGYIITNHHVVGDAQKITVTLHDGRKLLARRIGTDPETDIALIKIDGSGLATAVLGNSDTIEQGDWVLALGSPFGLQQTLTAGIVSATARELRNSTFERFIQTDAAINPGNSGGPLVSLRGEVIGINTAIYSRSGMGNEGVGFAIPSNMARKIYGELAKSGKVVRGYLGVFVKELTEADAAALGLRAKAGVLVSDVTDQNSPAAKAGIRSGDVVTAIDGKSVNTALDLTNAVADTPVGKTVRIDLLRDGARQTVNATLAERPARETARAESAEPDSEEAVPQTSRLGVSVQSVTPETAERYSLKIRSGAVIVGVTPAGPASSAGLRRGDVVHRVGRILIRSAADLAEAEKSLKSGEDVSVQVERGGQLSFLTLSLD
jgi:serine protease Do